MANKEDRIKKLNEMLKKFWPDWKIEEEIGFGTFSEVYKAVHGEFGVKNFAAIKVISLPSPDFEIENLRAAGLEENHLRFMVDNFADEIRLMLCLKGVPNIVSVDDFKIVERQDEIGWDIFIRMELLAPLSARLKKGMLSEDEVISLGCDICTALETCDKPGMIHRDIKPENIFTNEFGNFKLGGFGEACILEARNVDLAVAGTPSYMAPEVYGTRYDSRADIYSLGIVLYQLLNGGNLPFLDADEKNPTNNEMEEALALRLNGTRISAPRDGSDALKEIILRACAYNSEDRFYSAKEMKQALLRLMDGAYISQLHAENFVTILDENYDIEKTMELNLTNAELTDDEWGAVMPELKKLIKLKSLILADNKIDDLTVFEEFFESCALECLVLADNQIDDITPLEKIPTLRTLYLLDNRFRDISPLAKLTNLTKLDLSHNKIRDLTPLSKLTKLADLCLGSNLIEDVTPLSGLVNLKTLDLFHNKGMCDIAPLSALVNLEHLSLGCDAINDLTPLLSLANLNSLNLHGDRTIDFATIARLFSLKRLSLVNMGISDLAFLSGLTNLEELYLIHNEISDVTPLGTLTNLQELNLNENRISDVTSLSALTKLEVLHLGRNEISDISPLAQLTNLERLNLGGNPISDDDKKRLKNQLPNCDIFF